MIADKLWAYVWGGGLVLLSASPPFRSPAIDSYPLSTFPMFSTHRGQPLIFQIVAVGPKSERTPLPPRLVANSETLQAAATLSRAVQAGKNALRLFCHDVASRVAVDPEFAEAEHLEVRQVRYDPIGYFEQGPIPLEAKRLMKCRVFR